MASPYTVLIVQYDLFTVLFHILVTMRPLVFPALWWDDFVAYLRGLSVLEDFSPQTSFSHIVNCTWQGRGSDCTPAWRYKMQIRRSISFLYTYINLCKGAHGNSDSPSIHHPSMSWQSHEAHVPCAQHWNTLVLSPHLLGWDWNPSTSHQNFFLWTKVTCLCSLPILVLSCCAQGDL